MDLGKSRILISSENLSLIFPSKLLLMWTRLGMSRTLNFWHIRFNWTLLLRRCTQFQNKKFQVFVIMCSGCCTSFRIVALTGDYHFSLPHINVIILIASCWVKLFHNHFKYLFPFHLPPFLYHFLNLFPFSPTILNLINWLPVSSVHPWSFVISLTP